MIAHRITVRYQAGKLPEAIALLQAERERAKFPHAVRMYIAKSEVSDMSIGEYEFENIAEMEQFWSNWEAQPEAQAFLQQYKQLTEPGTIGEIFDLI